MRKDYSSPVMRVETIEVGVYGDYGSGDNSGSGGGLWGNIVGLFNPLCGLCCGGGGG